MHPILFHIGSATFYTYGSFIALGAVIGGTYMWKQGNNQYGMSFDQASALFALLIFAGAAGGKLFLVLENPSYYSSDITKLFSGSGEAVK